MAKKRHFNISIIGFSDSERLVLRSMFLLTTERARAYTLAERENDPPGEIVLVNGDNADAVHYSQHCDDLRFPKTSPRLYIGFAALTDANAARIQRPPTTTRLLPALDEITIKQLNIPQETTNGTQPTAQVKVKRYPRVSITIIGFQENERLLMRSMFLLTTEREPSYLLVERQNDPPGDIVLVNGDNLEAITYNLTCDDPRFPKGAPRLFIGTAALKNGEQPSITRPLSTTRLLPALDQLINKQRALSNQPHQSQKMISAG